MVQGTDIQQAFANVYPLITYKQKEHFYLIISSNFFLLEVQILLLHLGV